MEGSSQQETFQREIIARTDYAKSDNPHEECLQVSGGRKSVQNNIKIYETSPYPLKLVRLSMSENGTYIGRMLDCRRSECNADVRTRGYVANMASHTMNKAKMTMPRMSGIRTCAELHGAVIPPQVSAIVHAVVPAITRALPLHMD